MVGDPRKSTDNGRQAYDNTKAALAAGRDELVPQAVADQLIDGEAPLKVWRSYRNKTQAALAKASGVTQPMISQIENGKRTGDVETLRRLADALDILIDDLAA